MTMELHLRIEPFFDEANGTFICMVFDEPGGCAAFIDPLLDYDPEAGRTGTPLRDCLIAFLKQEHLTLSWILETHAHASPDDRHPAWLSSAKPATPAWKFRC